MCSSCAPRPLGLWRASPDRGPRGLLVGWGTPTHHLNLSSKALLPEPPPSPLLSAKSGFSFLPCAPPGFLLLSLCASDSAATESRPNVCCLPPPSGQGVPVSFTLVSSTVRAHHVTVGWRGTAQGVSPGREVLPSSFTSPGLVLLVFLVSNDSPTPAERCEGYRTCSAEPGALNGSRS